MGFFPANAEGDDIVVYTDEARRARARDLPHAAPAGGQAGRPARAGARRLRRPARDRARRLPRRLRRDHGRRPRRAWWRSSSATTTTTTRSWPRRWPTGWRRRSPRRCTSGRAQEWGYGRDENLAPRGADPRAVPRHPPRAGLSGLSRSHREADALRSAAGGGAHRDPPHRDLRDVAGGVGQRPLLLASGGALLPGGPDRRRPGARLRAPQGDGPARGRALAGAQSRLRPTGREGGGGVFYLRGGTRPPRAAQALAALAATQRS